MTDPFIRQLVQDRHVELLAEADRNRLAGRRQSIEPIFRIRFTFELQLGRKRIRA